MALEALAHKRGQAGRWYRHQVVPVLEEVHQAGGSIWRGGVRVTRPGDAESAAPPRCYQLYLHGKRGVLYTQVLNAPPRAASYLALFERLLEQANGKPVVLVFHGADFRAAPEIGRWLNQNPKMRLVAVPVGAFT
ncbi:hypothetical protein SAMN04487957_1095 [Halomonas shengliensis]|uniref:Uncharacterized protein n=2 Tax=Halomonas shengliensis TaxID=419597 RepID=A0A1H0L420_9GAMM|nr:hypothetical protein SAMN04487957_1095 [Halomonas shengliensis]